MRYASTVAVGYHVATVGHLKASTGPAGKEIQLGIAAAGVDLENRARAVLDFDALICAIGTGLIRSRHLIDDRHAGKRSKVDDVHAGCVRECRIAWRVARDDKTHCRIFAYIYPTARMWLQIEK